MASRKAEADVMQVVDPFMGTLNGVPVVYPKGTRLRADHPAVRAWPHMWAAEASEEFDRNRRALYERGEAAPTTKVLGPIPPMHRLRATRTERVRLHRPSGAMMTISAGEVVDGRSEVIKSIAKARPGLFEKVKP